jgi:hypothetical protein
MRVPSPARGQADAKRFALGAWRSARAARARRPLRAESAILHTARRAGAAGWCRPWFGPRSARSRVAERVFCSLSAAPARRHQQWRPSPSPTRLVGPGREGLYPDYRRRPGRAYHPSGVRC